MQDEISCPAPYLKRTLKRRDMEVELTKRWIVCHKHTSVVDLAIGVEVEYYGEGGGFIENPKKGEVKEKQGVLVIEWDDIEDFTILDGSEKCNSILKNCGV